MVSKYHDAMKKNQQWAEISDHGTIEKVCTKSSCKHQASTKIIFPKNGSSDNNNLIQ